MGVMGVALLTCSGGLAGRAIAQPAPRQNIQDWQNMTPEQVRQTLQNLSPEEQQQMQQMLQMLQMLTPQQQQQMLQNLPDDQQQKLQQAQMWLQDRIQQQRWNWIRQTLVASGYTDATLQDTVIDFMQAQEKVRQPLRVTAQDLANLLIEPTTPADELKTKLADFRDQMKKEEARYEQALASLDEKIKYSTEPRLETLLTVLGVVGQETSTLGGVSTLFPNSPQGNATTQVN